jgi:hypothetical protein
LLVPKLICLVSVLIERLKCRFDVRRGIQSESTEARMAGQPFFEIDKKSVSSSDGFWLGLDRAAVAKSSQKSQREATQTELQK